MANLLFYQTTFCFHFAKMSTNACAMLYLQPTSAVGVEAEFQVTGAVGRLRAFHTAVEIDHGAG